MSTPLSYYSRYEGIYTQRNDSDGAQKTGDVVIDVNGAGGYLTVSGPDALAGKQHNWDEERKTYYYADTSALVFSSGVVDPDAAFVYYASPGSYQGMVYGVK